MQPRRSRPGILDDVRIADVEAVGTFDESNEKYDAILFLDVLEHCHWPVEILKRARQLLAHEGFVIPSIQI
jgi:2-polyprenyl-3-methyl-5-hydroxy-6-metoxy-1,4-benzoquinol methylase